MPATGLSFLVRIQAKLHPANVGIVVAVFSKTYSFYLVVDAKVVLGQHALQPL